VPLYSSPKALSPSHGRTPLDCRFVVPVCTLRCCWTFINLAYLVLICCCWRCNHLAATSRSMNSCSSRNDSFGLLSTTARFQFNRRAMVTCTASSIVGEKFGLSIPAPTHKLGPRISP
jgi:hypothetical protein